MKKAIILFILLSESLFLMSCSAKKSLKQKKSINRVSNAIGEAGGGGGVNLDQ